MAANEDYSPSIVTGPAHGETDERFFDGRREYIGYGRYENGRDFDDGQNDENEQDDDSKIDDDNERDNDCHKCYLLLPKSSTISSATQPPYYDVSPITKFTIRLYRADWSLRTPRRVFEEPADASPGSDSDSSVPHEHEFEYQEQYRVRIRREIGLVLDPRFNPRGELNRASITLMEQMTEEHRVRPAPYPSESWDHRVMALFPDLCRLTFIWRRIRDTGASWIMLWNALSFGRFLLLGRRIGPIFRRLLVRREGPALGWLCRCVSLGPGVY